MTSSTRFPRIAIVGSRDFPSQWVVERFVYELPRSWTVVSGGARGVDKWAEVCALHHRRDVVVYEADWAKHGKAAGFIRNNTIVRDCDVVVAFWDGSSKGTRHSIQLAKYLKIPCIIVRMK
jgi:hypothetical protein